MAQLSLLPSCDSSGLAYRTIKESKNWIHNSHSPHGPGMVISQLQLPASYLSPGQLFRLSSQLCGIMPNNMVISVMKGGRERGKLSEKESQNYF